MIKFENSFHKLNTDFYENVIPSKPPKPELISFNKSLSNLLGIKISWIESIEGLECFTGKQVIKNSNPLAMVYAGHQFGNWVPRLGDGRAILLGEILDQNNERWDIQLKGSGLTPFSRNGDGKAALGPVLREYLMSEAMYKLGIPTTLALFIAKTGENVYREKVFPGAIITRVAKSHIRVGTFQYFASLGKYNLVKELMDYVIKRNFPEITTNQNKYLSFLKFVIDAQAKLISKWMSVGFIHGVMNTDNCSIVGDTIDYGPCAFMDKYNENTVFSSIDTFGRYSYKNQPLICQWNLAQLANCILPFLSDEKEKSIKIAQNEIDKYSEVYHNYFSKEIFKKLGFSCKIEDDNKLKDELFDIMKRDELDFTISFSNLYFELLNIDNNLSEFTSKSRDFTKWISKWKLRLKKEKKSVNQIAENLKQSNPIIIPRNHLVEEAINFALENDNFSKYFNLLKLVSDPFKYKEKYVNYYKPPDVLDENFKTFCGT